MRRRDPIRVGNLIGDWTKSTPFIARKIAEARLIDLWPVLVGDIIASYTTHIEVKGGKLFIKVSSSVARNEILMRREALKSAINRASGIELINAIIIK